MGSDIEGKPVLGAGHPIFSCLVPHDENKTQLEQDCI